MFLCCSSSDRTGGRKVRAISSEEGLTAGGVAALGAFVWGTLGGEGRAGGDEARGDTSSGVDVWGGGDTFVRGFWSSCVGGPEGRGGAAGSSDGGVEVGGGESDSCSRGGEARTGGARSS